MPLNSKTRKALAALANRLSTKAAIDALDLTDSAVEHVRRAFGQASLVKVRINSADRAERCAAAEELARRLECQIVQQVGRVVVLYRGEGPP